MSNLSMVFVSSPPIIFDSNEVSCVLPTTLSDKRKVVEGTLSPFPKTLVGWTSPVDREGMCPPTILGQSKFTKNLSEWISFHQLNLKSLNVFVYVNYSSRLFVKNLFLQTKLQISLGHFQNLCNGRSAEAQSQLTI